MSYKATEIITRDHDQFLKLRGSLTQRFGDTVRILDDFEAGNSLQRDGISYSLIETTALNRSQKRALRREGFEVTDVIVRGSGGGGAPASSNVAAPVAFLAGLIIGS